MLEVVEVQVVQVILPSTTQEDMVAPVVVVKEEMVQSQMVSLIQVVRVKVLVVELQLNQEIKHLQPQEVVVADQV